MTSFGEAWARVQGVEGWMTEAQAQRLFAASSRAPAGGAIVEIGSFRGRSAIILASAAPTGAEVVAIDPHLGSDRGPQEIDAQPDLGEEDVQLFRANLERAGVAGRVRHVRAFSGAALAQVPATIDVLYVDGAHRLRPARADVVRYGARVAEDGTMLVHDSFSSVGVTLALLSSVTFGATWRYAGRSGSLAEYRRASPAGAGERARNAGRQLRELPWFARNVAVKTSLVAGQPRLARALGHDVDRDGPWPY